MVYMEGRFDVEVSAVDQPQILYFLDEATYVARLLGRATAVAVRHGSVRNRWATTQAGGSGEDKGATTDLVTVF